MNTILSLIFLLSSVIFIKSSQLPLFNLTAKEINLLLNGKVPVSVQRAILVGYQKEKYFAPTSDESDEKYSDENYEDKSTPFLAQRFQTSPLCLQGFVLDKFDNRCVRIVCPSPAASRPIPTTPRLLICDRCFIYDRIQQKYIRETVCSNTLDSSVAIAPMAPLRQLTIAGPVSCNLGSVFNHVDRECVPVFRSAVPF